MVNARTMIHFSIRKLADTMVEIVMNSMQSILTAQQSIHLSLVMVNAITTLPIIPKHADSMVEIVMNSMQSILTAQQRSHLGLVMVNAVTTLPIIPKHADSM